MSKVTQRMPLPGPAFVRLLARLTDADVTPSRHALSERLSQWVDWNRAIALSKALDGSLTPPNDALVFDNTAEAECARIRESLTQAIMSAPELAITSESSDDQATAQVDAGAAQPDFSAFSKRYVARQQAMLTSTGYLRGRLRDMLAAQSPEKAQLAEVDAVMESTLSPREQSLLAAVPTLLNTHFDRLRQAAQTAPDPTDPSDEPPSAAHSAWLNAFRIDMQQLLLAELDVRFQPIDGLLAALRTP